MGGELSSSVSDPGTGSFRLQVYNFHARRSRFVHRRCHDASFLHGAKGQPANPASSGNAVPIVAYYHSRMSVLTCKLPSALDNRLTALAKRRGVSKSVLVREAIETKLAEEASALRRPANLIEALGESVGSISSGKRDLARNKKHLQSYGR